MLQGSCACGTVRYEVGGEPGRELLRAPTHCHCWQCRKHSGASFGTTSAVRSEDFRIVEGEERLACWESSPGVRRFFAGCCGSPLFKRQEAAPDFVALRLGSLDNDPGRSVEGHIFVDSKVPWVELGDDLPRKPGGVPFPRRD